MHSQEWYIGDVKINNRVIVGPMAGVSNEAFRSIAKQFGAGLKVDGEYGDLTYAASWHTISKGANGNITKSIQAALTAKGYEVEFTGYYGDDTEYTVAGYQNDIGMTPTGVVDQDTTAQLYT